MPDSDQVEQPDGNISNPVEPRRSRQVAKQHGVTAIQEHGPGRMTMAQAAERAGIAEDLKDAEGVRNALRKQCALVLTIVNIITRYLEKQGGQGVDISGMALLTSTLPQYINSSERLLGRLYAMLPRGASHVDELKKVKALVHGAQGFEDGADDD